MAVQHQIALPDTPSDANATEGSVFFIGTATVLLRCGGFTILTDPNFIHRHEQVDIGYGMKATRQTDPALELHDLPPIDLVVLSHFHGDHFDQVAERELDRMLPIVTTPEAAHLLEERGFQNLFPLSTWEAAKVTRGSSQLRITATPAQHGPALVDWALPDVMGSILDFSSADGASQHRLYITGDTLRVDELQEIPHRYPNIDLSLLHLGGTRVLGVLVTMDAEQGVEALRVIQPRLAIPIHYNDYDVFKSPLEDFQEAVANAGLTDRVHYLAHGETYRFPRTADQRAA
jgi:L-ascorbate metabolism protein UlaG (beta-lactamase superfamily)